MFVVRLRNGSSVNEFRTMANRLPQVAAVRQFTPNLIRNGLVSVRDASRVQAIALALVALAAWAAALVVLSQLITRSVANMGEEFSSVRAAGLPPTTRARLVSATFAPSASARRAARC